MDKKQFKVFLKYFIICAAIVILMIFLLWRNDLTIAFLKKLFGIIRPLIIGGAIAFILNRPMMKIQWLYKKLFNSKNRLNRHGKEKSYFAISIITVYILFIAIIAAIIRFIVPQFVLSLNDFYYKFQNTYYENLKQLIANINHLDLSFLGDFNIVDKLDSWKSSLPEKIPQIITTTLGITNNILNTLTDIFFGLIFSVYVLVGKKKLKNQTGKVFRSMLSERNYEKSVRFYNLVSNTFSNFINGQLTEACILGILCFIGMKIFHFQYPFLISVIIGITNLIPIFGPIIGTIPCSFILLLVNPISAVWFVVYIIVLQQIESNLIYPRVVGGSVGLAPVWTLSSILIGGGLFGVLGMLLAVPTMSIVYVTVGDLVNKKLKKKDSVTDAEIISEKI